MLPPIDLFLIDTKIGFDKFYFNLNLEDKLLITLCRHQHLGDKQANETRNDFSHKFT